MARTGVVVALAVALWWVASAAGHAPCDEETPDIIVPPHPPCEDIVCLAVYLPVCAAGPNTPLTTFSNRCVAGRYACQRQEVLVVAHEGECRCKPKPPPEETIVKKCP